MIYGTPDPRTIEMLAPYAWALIDEHDHRVRTGDVTEEHLKERLEFTLRVLCDIASLPTTGATT